jgi:hypothetical protein
MIVSNEPRDNFNQSDSDDEYGSSDENVQED